MSLTRPTEPKRRVIGNGLMMRTIKAPGELLRRAQEKYKEAKAELKGEARSKARMIKNYADIIGREIFNTRPKGPRCPEPTNVRIRMMDGSHMIYFDDGSLRHIFGRRVTKDARKRAKKDRQTELRKAHA